jgi:hypothetical protein
MHPSLPLLPQSPLLLLLLRLLSLLRPLLARQLLPALLLLVKLPTLVLLFLVLLPLSKRFFSSTTVDSCLAVRLYEVICFIFSNFLSLRWTKSLAGYFQCIHDTGLLHHY